MARKEPEGKLLQIGRRNIQEHRRGRAYYVRWWLKYELEDGEVAWRWSPSRAVHGKKAKAESEAEKYRQELELEIGKPKDDILISVWVDRFQAVRKAESLRDDSDLSPLTVTRDEDFLKRIKKACGGKTIKELTPGFIVDMYGQMLSEGESRNTVNRVHGKLRQVLDFAIYELSKNDTSLVMLNPCDMKLVKNKAKRPKNEEKEALTQEEALLLAKTILSERLSGFHVVVWLALFTGMRRGECLGLEWEDVDFKNGVINVRTQYGKEGRRKRPKTRESERAVAIDFGVVTFLTAWKRIQAEYFDSKDLEQSATSPVCNNTKGGFINPDVFSRWRREYFVKLGFGRFERLESYTDQRGARRQRKTGYVGKNLHTLRHTQSTLLIGGDLDVRTVQGRLGHSTPVMTLGYAHTISENDRRAARFIEELLGISHQRSAE